MLDAFIAVHEILRVGIAMPEHLCADLIVDDPAGLIDVIHRTDRYISAINWWEHAPIESGSKLGMGGPRDPRDPQVSFFSEVVHLGKTFEPSASREECLSYLEEVTTSYPELNLYPSFNIV